jgi:hypothetical protein
MRGDGEIIMRNWDLREFRVQVNCPFLIWQVLHLIRWVEPPIRGLLNPIRLVVPLTLISIRILNIRSHLHPSSHFLYHHCRTQS